MNNPIFENELSSKLTQLSAINDFIAGNLEFANAEYIAKHLYDIMINFQKSLSDSEDIAMTIVHFNASTLIFVNYIGYIGNSLIVFRGKDTNGSPLELIQHISQVNLLLAAVPKPKPEMPKRVIGFQKNPD